MLIKYADQIYRLSKTRIYNLTNQLWNQPFFHLIHLCSTQNHLLHMCQVINRLCHMHHSNHDNYSAPENYQNILLIMFVINRNLYMKPNAWWHNNVHGVMRSKFLICMYVQAYIKVLIFAFLSKCMRA